jgi:hypothetical protein
MSEVGVDMDDEGVQGGVVHLPSVVVRYL